MIFRRGLPLVPDLPRAVQLTGALDLRNLETTGELKLEDLLLTASDSVFDRLVADGVDPEQLTNPEVYERVVAWLFLGILAAQSYLDGDEEAGQVAARHFGLADRFYEQVRPRLQSGQAPPAEGLAVVRNPLP